MGGGQVHGKITDKQRSQDDSYTCYMMEFCRVLVGRGQTLFDLFGVLPCSCVNTLLSGTFGLFIVVLRHGVAWVAYTALVRQKSKSIW